MKKAIGYLVLMILMLLSNCLEANNNQIKATVNDSIIFKKGYSEVNGIKMYYEIYGEGKPLVLLHGGGSTIETTFGRVIPMLAKHRKVIAVEAQAHGRTGDREKEESFV
ncbi:alpha/beta hydrolase [Flavobacterium sp. LS1R49]|uniref:Alpha/beta hydrolase n=1 Tax=Flavobacterium shii TaxID=2987687 RepID=A0A9X3BXV8_9FLAO|nr:alpha/beta hydrolase [Flavobacterium shii]MCV9927865.1 alpha/beta hydrolase [Flavobacterium shii]